MPMPSSQVRLKMVDAVETRLSDQLAVQLDREVRAILPRLRRVVVERRFELRERPGEDRARGPQDGDLEVRDQLPQPREIRPLDRTEHDAVTLQHARSLRGPSPSVANDRRRRVRVRRGRREWCPAPGICPSVDVA